jgi:hypothetical protein
MHKGFCCLAVIVCVWSLPVRAQNQISGSSKTPGPTMSGQLDAVPRGVILVKGAWSGASDATTPLPENGVVGKNVFRDRYFGISYPLPDNWTEQYKGPPPSDSGRYVLAQISPTDAFQGAARGTILITADDMFFTRLPASSAVELVNFSKDHLEADHRLEQPPEAMTLGGHRFISYRFWSPVAGLHWYVVATEIRCHTVQFIFNSRDPSLLDKLLLGMDGIHWTPASTASGGGDVPVCVKNYATDHNLISRVEPDPSGLHANAVPVRIIIDKAGHVRHIHFPSAFPDQQKTIGDALKQWRFKPYLQNGRAVEVETGIVFGRSPN